MLATHLAGLHARVDQPGRLRIHDILAFFFFFPVHFHGARGLDGDSVVGRIGHTALRCLDRSATCRGTDRESRTGKLGFPVLFDDLTDHFPQQFVIAHVCK